jgi:hydrogenase maturation factor
MLGEVEENKLVLTSGALEGDQLIMTKGFPIEGTAIIAHEKEEELLEKGYSKEFIKQAKNYLRNPGISVVKDALIANNCGGVHSMHDPTEGGLAQGIYEMARASGLGVLINDSMLTPKPEARKLCSQFGLDPLGTITSGTLLIAASKHSTDKIIKELWSEGIPASNVGEFKNKDYGYKVIFDGWLKRDLEYSEKDEITKLFE